MPAPAWAWTGRWCSGIRWAARWRCRWRWTTRARSAGGCSWGGYFYPTWRLDSLLAAAPAAPLLGDVLRHTVTALSVRATLESLAAAMFAPRAVPPDFLPRLSREMLVRPSQLRGTFEDGSVMRAQARATAARHGQLRRLPLTLVTGDADMVVDGGAHAVRLHRELLDSRLIELAGVGHMTHHADPQAVVEAVKEVQAQQRGAAAASAAPVRTGPAVPPPSAAVAAAAQDAR